VAGKSGRAHSDTWVYKSTSVARDIVRDLTLDAQGNANAVFIFQMASTLTTYVWPAGFLAAAARKLPIFFAGRQFRNVGNQQCVQRNIMADQSDAEHRRRPRRQKRLARLPALRLQANVDYQARRRYRHRRNSGWIDGAGGFGRWLGYHHYLANAGPRRRRYS